MRIGIAISKDDPQIGGGLTYIQEILEAINNVLAESKHTFYLIGYEPEKPAHLSNILLPWLTLQQAGLLSRPPARDYEYFPDIAAANLDLICYLQPWMGEILDIPYISTVWDLQHRLQPFFPEVSLFGEFDRREEMYRRSLQRAAYIITPNEVGKQEIVRFYQVSPERVWPIALPTPAFALAPQPHPDEEGLFLRLGVNRPYLFYPAQLWPHKNHILLLLMLKDLKSRHGLDLQLVLTGSDRKNLPFVTEKIAQLGLEDQVILGGFVNQPDLAPIYRRAAALVFPSLFGPENFPPLEAFALECPVIAGRIPGAQEQMGDAAVLVDPTNHELWSDAVACVVRDKEIRATLIARGRKRAQSFGPMDFARKLLRLFDEFELYRRTWPSSKDTVTFD
ncbi:MAG: glycosyltransferase family 4 protein [Verrucomicrobia bacterium]|nr:glycosyltransferase family 4 protein [Verrucomicrobiota bacterium]